LDAAQGALLEEVLVVSLDQVRAILADHVDGVLDAAVRNDRDIGRVDDPEVLDAVDLQVRVNDTLVDVLG
jgi:hypothetical protein